jgi:OmpA-OmpF porin, OOP family
VIRFISRLAPSLFILLLISLASEPVLHAQNLVPNWSFETYKVCPGTFSQSLADFTVTNWQSAGLGVPDHFHYCSRGEAGVPYNWAGVAEAYEGDAYAGLYLWMADESNYREYLQCKLNEKLTKDSTYYVEFHFKLASYSNYCIDRIGLLFTGQNNLIKHDKVIDAEPSLVIIRDSALTKTTGLWEAARFEYVANGNETSIIIGNFSNDAETGSYRIRSRVVSEPMLSASAYYYVDGVVVVPKFRVRDQLATQIVAGFKPEATVLNTPYVLNNLQFESNSAKLGTTSFVELDALADFMRKNNKIKIEVSGHTDDVGETLYNLDLSRQRSETVSGYLQSKGIEKIRITTSGFGESQPLIVSTSTDARKLNRRVEVKFVE